MNAYPKIAAFAGITCLLLATGISRAEKADRDKPVNIDADRVSVDDVKRTQIFEGNVQLAKGTLVIRAERIVVQQDDDGYQRGVASGGGTTLPNFRQKREGMDEYIEGEAERIEHDAKGEKTEFFGRARVKSGLDEVRGQFISYDARTEQYVVTSGPNGTRAPSGSRERVRAVIQPRNKDAAAPAANPAPGPALKNTQDFSSQRQEKAK
jgi:lipopolysaccharide export system protein LptA